MSGIHSFYLLSYSLMEKGKKKLVVLSGVPGSGKSYFSDTIKKYQCAHVYIVSSDGLRNDLTGSQRNFTHEKEVWEMFYDLPVTYSKDDEAIVILDATNARLYFRLLALEKLQRYFDETILVSFNLDKDLVRKQNLEREYPIPAEALEDFFVKFEPPTKEEYEVFDRVYVVSTNEIEEVVKDIMTK